MDIITGMAIAGQALDIVKKLRDLEADLKSAEVKLQLADLYGKVAELRIALADAELSLRDRDDQIRTLKQKSVDRIETIAHNGFNFGKAPDGKPFSRPFCPTCEQTGGLQLVLQNRVGGTVVCPKCQGVFDGRMTFPPKLSDQSGGEG